MLKNPSTQLRAALRKTIPPSGTTQWRPHQVCAEPVEVKTIEQYGALVEQVNGLEGEYEAFSDEALRAKTDEFRKGLAV